MRGTNIARLLGGETEMSIVASPTGNQTIISILSRSTDWRTAAVDLVAWMVGNDRCFSSGEIAAYMRTYRPNLAFQVPCLGEYLRDQYDCGLFPQYDFQGGKQYPTQVPRTTTGVATTLDGRNVQGRTPAGMGVMVYAPDGAEGFAHDFEVFIPDWNDPQALNVQPATQSAVQPTANSAQPTSAVQPPPAVGILITGSLKRDDLEATVRADRRLCVPRAAFEAFVGLTGIPLRGGPQGDPVHITFEQRSGCATIVVTRDPTSGSEPYHLWVSRGRIAIAAKAGFGPFTPNDKHTIKVTATEMVIDISAPI